MSDATDHPASSNVPLPAELPAPPDAGNDSDAWRTLGRLEEASKSHDDRLRDCQRDVEDLRKRVDKPKPRLDKVAAILSLVALVFSLLNAPAEFLEKYFKSPKTSVQPGGQATFRYDKDTRKLHITWPVTIINEGTAADHVGFKEAYLRGSRGISHKFEKNAVAFVPKGPDNSLLIRVGLKGEELVHLTLALQLRLSESEIHSMTDPPARMCVDVVLNAKREVSLPLKGCFDLTLLTLQEVQSESGWPITFDESLHRLPND